MAVKGDPGAESVFNWDKKRKGVNRRGAGPMDASLFGRGAGEGLGVHICTGPVAVKGAQPGDILEVRIGKGVTMHYPVAVPGGLLSVGDPHASQGDSELCGTAIECSLTGTFQRIACGLIEGAIDPY